MSSLRIEQVQAGISPARIRIFLGERKTLLTVDEAVEFRKELDAAIIAAEEGNTDDDDDESGWL